MKHLRVSVCAAVAALAVTTLSTAPAFAQATVAAIKQRGMLNCGVDAGIPGFAYQDKAGKWVGFDVDYCRAISAAVLGDSEKVKYVGTTAKVRFTVLQSGEIDVLIRDSTLTFTRVRPPAASSSSIATRSVRTARSGAWGHSRTMRAVPCSENSQCTRPWL